MAPNPAPLTVMREPAAPCVGTSATDGPAVGVEVGVADEAVLVGGTAVPDGVDVAVLVAEGVFEGTAVFVGVTVAVADAVGAGVVAAVGVAVDVAV